MKSVIFSALLVLFLPFVCRAQYDDFQTWSSVTLEKSFSKKLKGSVEEQLRLRENSTQFRQLHTDFSLRYNVIKYLNVALNYRFIIKPHEIDHRIYSDISYPWEQNKLKITPRIRLQHEFVQNTSDNNYIRPKLTIEYRVEKKWNPFVSGELFYRILYYKGDELDEYRLSAGIGYDFSKDHSLKIFYLLQQEFNVNAVQQNHILGIGYEYDL